jgi:thioredoxin reductase
VKKPEPVAIIGAGPAGITAAIQLKRYGLSPMLFEKEAIGGLLRNANWVENYPGFPNGISGLKLTRLMAQQLKTVGVEGFFEEVLELDYAKEVFTLETPKQRVVLRHVIVATGTESNPIESPVVPPAARPRVFHEIHSLLRERGKRVFIVGAGDAAFDYALNLAKANEITLLNRGNAVKSLPLLVERAKASPRICYRPNTAITRITLREGGNDLSLECLSPAGPVVFIADYLIFAIGRHPKLDFLSERLLKCKSRLEESGQLFFIGDVKNGLFRQTAIAVGDGMRAAMELYKESL